MCLKVKDGPLIAKKDFYVMKLAEDCKKTYCTSFFQEVKQFYNSVLTSKLDSERDWYGGLRIDKGLHAFIIKEVTNNWILESYDLIYNRGLILCKIPKGSTYYLGETGDIVSNELHMLEPVVLAKRDPSIIKRGMYVKKLSMQEAVKEVYKYCEEMELNINPS